MGLYAMLSLDYEERGPSRANFYAHLSSKGWNKLGGSGHCLAKIAHLFADFE